MTDTGSADPSPQERYDAMWADAWPAIAAGRIDCDAHLAHGRDVDARRGLTLIVRPGPALRAAFQQVLDRLTAIAPGQYPQPPSDLHLTVLSLCTVAADNTAHLARLDEYRAAVRAALQGMAPFDIAFRGLTASRGAVVAQGHPHDSALAALRERVRAALRTRALDASLDGRYRLVTAHMTLLRFARPLADPAHFAAALAALRDVPLGTLHAAEVELVVNDWYMTEASVTVVERFGL
jgi:2'-5' RNA ligase